VNLTAFNGLSQGEGDYPDDPDKQNKLLQNRPWGLGSDLNNYLSKFDAGKQVWYFRSTERGFWSRLNYLGAAATPPTSPPQRLLWAQEPALVNLKKAPFELFDLIPSRQMTMRVAEVPPSIASDQSIIENHMNMVMEHTLGFGNESYGVLYDAQGAKQPGTPTGSTSTSTPPVAAAIGAPAPCDFTWDNNVRIPGIPGSSTNPWLEWGNRPYVSAEELLNVPVGSQSTMLRFFSAVAPVEAYDGTGLDPMGKPVSNPARLTSFRSPFGQLMNFTQTAAMPTATRTSFFTWVLRISIAFSITCRCRRGMSAPTPCSTPRHLTTLGRTCRLLNRLAWILPIPAIRDTLSSRRSTRFHESVTLVA
jgi:hypothetical protein